MSKFPFWSDEFRDLVLETAIDPIEELMSTKSTIYHQGGPEHDDGDYLHVYFDMGGHQPRGFYIDTAGDVARIEDPLKLADELKRVLALHAVADAR